MTDDELDALLGRLSHEGFGLPYMARVRDYMPEDRVYGNDSLELAALQAADRESNEQNRAALRRALDAICDADFVLFKPRASGTGQMADRIVRCALPQGHDGPHFDGGDQHWEDADIKPWTPQP